MGIIGHDNNCDNEADGDLPSSVDELLAQIPPRVISTGYQNIKDILQHGKMPATNTSGSSLDRKESRLNDGAGASQVTRGMRAVFTALLARSLLTIHRQTSDSRR